MKQVGVTGSRLSGREVNNREETLTDGFKKKKKKRAFLSLACVQPEVRPLSLMLPAKKKRWWAQLLGSTSELATEQGSENISVVEESNNVSCCNRSYYPFRQVRVCIISAR